MKPQEEIKDQILEAIALAMSEEFNLPSENIYSDLDNYSLAELSRRSPLALTAIFSDSFAELEEKDENEDGVSVRHADELADDMADFLHSILLQR